MTKKETEHQQTSIRKIQDTLTPIGTDKINQYIEVHLNVVSQT